MLSENPLVVDLNVYHLSNLFNIFEKRSKKKEKTILLLIRENKILKAINKDRGIIFKDRLWEGKKSLKEIYISEKADYIFGVDVEYLDKILSEFSKKVNYDEDYFKQVFCLLKAISNYIGVGIFDYPERLKIIKFLNYSLFEGIFRVLFPKNCSIVFVLFDNKKIFSSIILGIRNYEISLITTTELLEDDNLDFKLEDYNNIINLIRDKFEKPYVGIFLKREVLENLPDKRKLKFLKTQEKLGKFIIKPKPLKFSIILDLGRIVGL